MTKTGLKDKVALVTGANHGIGAATAQAFAKEGAKVFIHYLRLSPETYGGISQEEADKATGGRIINISTDGAYAHASNVSYGASKFAVESYSRAAAYELGPYGITVNVISPGAVQTGWMTPVLEKAIAEGYPLRRIGKPEDIANAVIFFASEQAEWITGQVLHVGGGNRM